MTQYIIFIKSEEFLDIKEGDVFKIFFDYDDRPYIKIRSKIKIYLTKRRNALNYYRRCKLT